ncbi:MFS transporter [Acidianus sp. HS-5]|uniref:MFS transporter n=1 Tax=Acidianus sp. HS-5 TaxID=2886040 RepID=UPI001F22B3E5|nr:MFS transporter [Acidianus sp. HS-5]BDC17850.1 MFS transporter [Acidianus sp. HS-5]
MDKISLITFIVVLGTMMAAIDSTIVILALPTMIQCLHTDLLTLIWVILIYLLTTAVLTTQLGRLGDRLGRGRIYNLGFIIFTAGSALCGASPTATFLVSSRAIQAVGASMLQANSGAIIADNYPPNRRGKAYGYTSIGWNVGAILGIILGGILTTFVGWRYIFYINVPIGVIAVILGLREIKDKLTLNSKFDIGGVILLASSLILVTYGAAEIAGIGITSTNVVLILSGILLLIPFYFVEKKQQFPLIDFKVFTNRVLTSSLLASFLQSAGYLATAFILIMYLQGIRGLTPFNASLLLVPGYVLASMISPITGRLSDKIGARIPATIGIGLMMIAAFIYAHLTLTTPYYYIILTSIVGGLGSSFFYPANNSAIMSNAPRNIYGGVSGIMRTLANIGILISYVIAISIASLTIPRYVAFEVFLGTYSLGELSGKFLLGIHSAFYASIVILSIALVLSAIRGKEERSYLN